MEFELEQRTDEIMNGADTNMDGFIDWPEFVTYVDSVHKGETEKRNYS